MAVTSRVQAIFSANSEGLVAGTKRAANALENMQRSIHSLTNATRLLTVFSGVQLFGSITAAAGRAASAITNFAGSIYGKLASAVESATSLGEETSKSFVVFQNAASQIQKFAASAATIGLSETAALQATGTFGTLFRAMGVGTVQAAEYSQTLTRLGADLASFSNTSVEEALLAVGAALRGEAEPIRRFGVLLDDATLKNEALAQGLIKTTKGTLSPATRAMAAYGVILRQTALAQGDFSRTSDGLANLQRVIQAKAANTVATIGNAFEPLFQSVAASLSKVLTVAGPVFEQISAKIQATMAGIGQAVERLNPMFLRFIASINGAEVGNKLSEVFLNAAIILGKAADYVESAIGSVANNFASSAETFSIVTNTLSRVALLFKAVFDFVAAVIQGVAALTSRIVARLADYMAALPDALAGSGWEEYAENARRAAAEMSKTADASLASGIQNAYSAVAANAGQALAESMDRPIGRFEKFARDITSISTSGGAAAAGTKAVTTAGAAAAKSVEEAGKKASTAIRQANTGAGSGADSRSVEGVAEIARAINSARTEKELEIARRQLRALEMIAAKETYRPRVAEI